MCFFYAVAAEKLFGIAAITGAYMAGLMLSGLDDTSFVDRKVIVSGYMIFTPMFFAYIGISADFSDFEAKGLIFAAVFVIFGILGKIVGCAAAAAPFGYSPRDCLGIGCGMTARGEVALAVYATGQTLIYHNIGGETVGIDPLVSTICLIIVTSVLCPILLKLCFRNSPSAPPSQEVATRASISAEAIENVHEDISE